MYNKKNLFRQDQVAIYHLVVFFNAIEQMFFIIH